MGVINPGIWAIDSRVKMHNLCRVLKLFITAVLMVTSGPKNSQNKWLLMMMLFMVNYDDIMMMMMTIMII
jgi:hypothetical protein